jgi:hypothetical protein
VSEVCPFLPYFAVSPVDPEDQETPGIYPANPEWEAHLPVESVLIDNSLLPVQRGFNPCHFM